MMHIDAPEHFDISVLGIGATSFHLFASFFQVPSAYSQNPQLPALDAAATLCRHVDGDLVAEVPFICERSLALMPLRCIDGTRTI